MHGEIGDTTMMCRPGLTEFDEDLKLRGEEELNLFLAPPPATPIPTPPRLDDGGLRSCSDSRYDSNELART
jgi:hypothetical protein